MKLKNNKLKEERAKKIKKAYEFAKKAHKDQKYGEHPYTKHLEDVAQIVSEHIKTMDPEPIQLAYLHDVVEDTDITLEDIKNVFGPYMRDLVSLVTDEPGKNRKERKRKTNLKLSRVFLIPYFTALLVKSADRLANVKECVKNNDKKLKMYKKEHEAFVVAVYRESEGIQQIISKIDDILL